MSKQNEGMCGRYTLTVVEGFEDFYEIDERVPLKPRYNIAPTQDVPVVTRGSDGRRRVQMMHWGLIPSWSEGPSDNPARMINARSETADTKSSFREAFQARRCLVPADGFYEWLNEGGKKVPVHFSLLGGERFAFAGLWERWQGPSDDLLLSTTILTTEPNSLVAAVHDRMPAILPRERFSTWLDSDTPPSVLKGILGPLPANIMRSKRVSRKANKASAEGPELLEEVRDWRQPGLF